MTITPTDLLLRRTSPETGAAGPAGGQEHNGEVMRILAKDAAGVMPAEDRDYLVHLVAARTGLNQDEAQKRVDQVSAQVKDAAALGGMQRDEHP